MAREAPYVVRPLSSKFGGAMHEAGARKTTRNRTAGRGPGSRLSIWLFSRVSRCSGFRTFETANIGFGCFFFKLSTTTSNFV